MTPVSFEGSVEIRKPEDMTDEQCMSVWAKYGFGKLIQIINIKRGEGVSVVPPLYAGIDSENFPYYMTAWKPNYEDLQALNRGEPVYIKVVSKALPPMAVFTLDEKGNCNDAG